MTVHPTQQQIIQQQLQQQHIMFAHQQNHQGQQPPMAQPPARYVQMPMQPVCSVYFNIVLNNIGTTKNADISSWGSDATRRANGSYASTGYCPL